MNSCWVDLKLLIFSANAGGHRDVYIVEMFKIVLKIIIGFSYQKRERLTTRTGMSYEYSSLFTTRPNIHLTNTRISYAIIAWNMSQWENKCVFNISKSLWLTTNRSEYLRITPLSAPTKGLFCHIIYNTLRPICWQFTQMGQTLHLKNKWVKGWERS